MEVKESRITLHASCATPQQFVDINAFLDWVDEEIAQCVELLEEKPESTASQYALRLVPLVRRKVKMRDTSYLAGGFRFQLDYDEIINLLMDKALYPDPILFLRELLQNALDACRMQYARAQEEGLTYRPRIFVEDLSEEEADPRIVFQDNGIGMTEDIVKNFFLRVGKSYYRSGEFLATRERLLA